jgi:hypothetical protein
MLAAGQANADVMSDDLLSDVTIAVDAAPDVLCTPPRHNQGATMTSLGRRPALLALAILAGMATSGCGRTFVVVPRPAGQYTATDTLYATHKGRDVRVTFRFDSILRVDTVVRVRVDTAWVRGSRTIVRVDTLLRVDTVRVPITKTAVRVDTVRVPMTRPVVRMDTLLRVDTVRVPTTRTVVRVDTLLRVDTVRVPAPRSVVRTDTITRVDTLRVVVTDTVIRTVSTPGRRMLFVPPGHYPPDGQCRVWIHDLPPGRQAQPAACTELGNVPAGAFVLFGGDAWDFDYDWIAEAEMHPGRVPPEIIALKGRRRR